MPEAAIPIAIFALILSVVAFSMAMTVVAERSGTRLTRLERRVESMAERMGMPPDPAQVPSSGVLSLLEQGKKIAAVKLYQQENGVDIAEAKDAVDEFERARAQA